LLGTLWYQATARGIWIWISWKSHFRHERFHWNDLQRSRYLQRSRSV